MVGVLMRFVSDCKTTLLSEICIPEYYRSIFWLLQAHQHHVWVIISATISSAISFPQKVSPPIKSTDWLVSLICNTAIGTKFQKLGGSWRGRFRSQGERDRLHTITSKLTRALYRWTAINAISLFQLLDM